VANHKMKSEEAIYLMNMLNPFLWSTSFYNISKFSSFN